MAQPVLIPIPSRSVLRQVAVKPVLILTKIQPVLRKAP